MALVIDSGLWDAKGEAKRKERLTVERDVTVGDMAAVSAAGASALPSPCGVSEERAYDGCLPDASVGLLEALPRQRGVGGGGAGAGSAVPAMPVVPVVARAVRFRPWLLLPSPIRTPFAFGYTLLLAVTSLVTEYAAPSVVHDLYQASSTDVAHLVRSPVTVLVASALWIAGGLLSPYVIGFLLALTALERRIGGVRTAGVFLLGHVLATLATEGSVGVAVLVGHLPESSLHRLDYGVSFGVAASVGALAGLLTPWLRWPLLVGFGGMVVMDLIAFTDPMTNWGHLMAFGIGVASWPLVRRWRRERL